MMKKSAKITVLFAVSSALLLGACNSEENEETNSAAGNEENVSNESSDNNHNMNGMHNDENMNGMRNDENMNGMHDDENMNGMRNDENMNGMHNDENMNGMHNDMNGMHDEEHMNEMHDHHEEGSEDRAAFEEEAAELPEDFNEEAAENLLTHNTKNVTRLDSAAIEEMSILSSQTIWPATHEANQPGTIILADAEEWQHALAALTLVHHPNDGPLLLMKDGLTDSLLAEVNRLAPLGNEDGIEIVIAADLSNEEEEMMEEYETENVYQEDPAQFAQEIEEKFAGIIGEVPESVIIGSMEEEYQTSSMIAGSWISHMNESLLYVNEEVPDATRDALEMREGDANIYLLGNSEAISEEVEEELQEYGSVERISGDSPAELSIAFASYQDEHFGWGIDEPGHGLVFASTDDPELALPGMPLAHLGKHAPLIWLENDELMQEHADYLAKLKPAFEEAPMEGPYNHSYILGDDSVLSMQTQGIIDDKLEIEALDGGGHGDH